MIVYKCDVAGFLAAVESSTISEQIQKKYKEVIGSSPSYGERQAWQNSMNFVYHRLKRAEVPHNCGVLIEFVIPTTRKRIDILLSGLNSENKKQVLIIELKQWTEARLSDKTDLVMTRMGGGLVETPHPSYQAYSYLRFLTDLHESFSSREIQGTTCVYLHNYHAHVSNEPLLDVKYKDVYSEAPMFFHENHQDFEDFLSAHLSTGDECGILDQVEKGPFKPSKRLIDEVAGLFNGNTSYVMLDEQKVAFENIISAALRRDKKKRTVIVKGGPGTGKSVISINAFGYLIRADLNARFVAPNAAFRNVTLQSLLGSSGRGTRMSLKNLFTGSASFHKCNENTYDALVVDEAHRLKGKGAYQYFGDSQVEDVLNASRVNVFFVDDDQRIRRDDVGCVEAIRNAAYKFGSEVVEIELTSQYRCSGADGYIQWLNDALGICQTANFDGWDPEAYEFRICDTPSGVRELIKTKIAEGHRARLLAGYAWAWSNDGNSNGQIEDVSIPEHDFSMPWNGRSITDTWAIHPDGERQVGCVHTSQGLEFDYVGVIIGKDLQFNLIDASLTASWNDYKDTTGKKGLKNDPESLTKFICNIYKVLMTRGMKGCFVFCQDPNLAEYFRHRLTMASNVSSGV